MRSRECPRANELDALASSRPVPAAVQQHVESCATCNQIVADLRCQHGLLQALREAQVEALDERTQASILDACARTAKVLRGNAGDAK